MKLLEGTFETRLKAAVIDRLFQHDYVCADSVIISEMVVANWSRRADIVLANGKLCAFEIKSEVDSLARLPGQIADFAYHFEKLIVVVAGRFEAKARDLVTDGVGLWVQDQDGILKERVRPRVLPLAKEASISLMTAAEVRRLLACNGQSVGKDVRRNDLDAIAMGLPASDLADAARSAVKQRHRCRHQKFMDTRAIRGTVAAMQMFQRSSGPAPSVPAYGSATHALPEISVPDDHPQLIYAPAGRVIRRLTR
jgi:hypothetical protein